jgi:murein L,D-transpeptidase YcbB/YkuD
VMSRIVWNCRGVARARQLISLAVAMIIATALAVSFSSAQTKSDSTAGELSIELNIPAFRLDVLRGGERLHTYVVAVGLPRYQTPVGDFSITQITWNPWWYPPKSYWARHEKITRPGPQNPMGKVKLLVAASVYLHASPFTSSIGSAASHGCVRMRPNDAVELARRLQSTSGAWIRAASVDSLVASWSETRVVDLPVAAAVRFVYELAEVRGDSLLLHPDVYRRGDAEAEALRALADASHDTTRVDRGALRLLVRRARTQHVSGSIARLVSNDSMRSTRLENRAQRKGIADGADRKPRTSAMMNADCGGSGPGASFY